MARIVRFHQTGAPEVLKIENVEVPPPGPGEVRIAVKAIGLNRAESMFRTGHYLEQPQFPSRLGYEVSGTIESVGSGVTDFKVGDAVGTIPAFLQGQHGVYGELATVPASSVAMNPKSLDWIQASAIWMQYLTAYGALVDIAHLNRGEYVVIPAASSSVGIAAIQIANMLGAHPIALTRTSTKAKALTELGAEYIVATEEQDLVKEVMKITNQKGARIVFDPVGGPTVEKLAKVTADHGIVFQYGALSGDPTPLPLFDVLGKCLTIRGYLLFEVTQNPGRLEVAKKFVTQGLEAGALKPIIAKTFEFDQIVDAHRYLESSEQVGKIVVTV